MHEGMGDANRCFYTKFPIGWDLYIAEVGAIFDDLGYSSVFYGMLFLKLGRHLTGLPDIGNNEIGIVLRYIIDQCIRFDKGFAGTYACHDSSRYSSH